MTVLVGSLLGLAVCAAWLATIGFLRLPGPLARLHAVSFLAITGGIALLAAAALTDGFTDRVLKILLIVLASVVGGAAMTHALGQAIDRRSATSPPEPEDA